MSEAKPCIHLELTAACFPLETKSLIKPELAGPVTLRSILYDRHLNIYTHAPITRLNHEGKRIDDIRTFQIDYNYQATDLANMEDAWTAEIIRDDIRKALSLAGDDGDWQSGVRNVQAALGHYIKDNISNRIEFERLIADALRFLEKL